MENSISGASQFLAFDFGASSGRAILGEIKEEKLTLKEIHQCQLTANTTGKKVVAGPVEATAIGNIIIQAQALGIIRDASHGKEIIKNSFEMIEYKALNNEQYALNYERFLKITL